MTGYKSKKEAALDEDGMYLVHHTKRKDDDDDAQGYIAKYEAALQKEYQRGYDAGKAAALKLALRDLENAEIATDSTYESTALIREALAQPEQDDDDDDVYHLRQYGDVSKEQLDRYLATGDINPKPEQEPVAWMSDQDVGFKKSEFGATPTVPLYTSPPQRTWVGLTAEQAAECWTTSATQTWKNFEAKLKERNA